MNKISKFLAFFAAIFLVLGLFSCQLNVSAEVTPTVEEDPANLDISTAAELRTFLTNNSTTGKLTANITVTTGPALSGGKKKTIDLNGKTLTVNGATNFFTVEGAQTELTIKDSTEAKDGSIVNSASMYAFSVGAGSKLVLDSGIVSAYRDDVEAIYVNGGTFELKGGKVLAAQGNTMKGTAISATSTATVTITSGTVKGKTGLYLNTNVNTSISGLSIGASQCGIFNKGTISSLAVTGCEVYLGSGDDVPSLGAVSAIYNLGTITTITAGEFTASVGTGITGLSAVYGLRNDSGATIGNITGGIFAVTNSSSPTQGVYAFFNAANGTVTANGGTFTIEGTGATAANVNNGTFNNASQAPMATFTPALTGTGSGTGMPQGD